MEKESLYKFFMNQSSEKEQIAILDWVDLCPDNKKELLAQRKLFDALMLSDSADLRRRENFTKMPKWTVELLKYAAVVAVMCSLGGVYLYNMRQEMLTACNTIAIPAGQHANITLPDGTHVSMNALSELKYPTFFAGNERRVELKGEAFFTVKHDKKHPFIVETFLCDVKVLGTEFNIEARAEAETFVTSLVKGRVHVTDRKNFNEILNPNEQVRYLNGRLEIGLIPEHEEFLWREGLLAFRNASFVDLIEQIEKYYDVKIVIRMTDIPTNRITGKIRIADGADHALRVLQRNAEFSYSWNDVKDVIYIQ